MEVFQNSMAAFDKLRKNKSKTAKKKIEQLKKDCQHGQWPLEYYLSFFLLVVLYFYKENFLNSYYHSTISQNLS